MVNNHYTLQMLEIKQTWRGFTVAETLWCENFEKHSEAVARSDEMTRRGLAWVLHDWGTDPGIIPAPLLPGEDNDDPDSWEYHKIQRQIERINERYEDVPF